MDYTFKFKYSINIQAWVDMQFLYGLDDDGYDENGNIILPYIYWVFFFPEVFEPYKMEFTGQGTGEIVTAFDDWEVGDEANLKVTQIALVKPEGTKWPVELCFLY
jgi:hypothetical protein